MSEFVRFDLHVHSSFSRDSRLSLTEVAERLAHAGLSGVAITDHNSSSSHAHLAELGRRYPSYVFVPGVEVSAREGHVLVYGVSDPPPRDRSLAEVLDWARSSGGVSVLAHPLRWTHGVGRRLSEQARVDGIEGLNGHNAAVPNARAEVIATRRRLAVTGGSDAHDLGGIGRTFTRIASDDASVEGVLRAIREARTDAGGTSQTVLGRLQLSLGAAGRRVGRGFRGV